MKVSESTINIMASLFFKGIGKAWVVKNQIYKLSENEIVELIQRKTQLGINDVKSNFILYKDKSKKIIKKYDDIADGIVSIGEGDFPECRGSVSDADRPIILAYKGDIHLLKTPSVAVIGLLNPEGDIEERERKIVRGIVEKNFTIVSGLALGCDAISHTEALANNGKTIAILPSTLKSIQPVSNRALADSIVKNGGLLITEYLTEAANKQKFISRFIERDRLQAYFSDLVLLSASYAPNNMGNDCGSRHALNAAQKANIKRAVMYSETDKYNPQFDLNRQIIKEDGVCAIFSESLLLDIEKKRERGNPQQTYMF